jgi:signal transduction histidine kinase
VSIARTLGEIDGAASREGIWRRTQPQRHRISRARSDIFHNREWIFTVGLFFITTVTLLRHDGENILLAASRTPPSASLRFSAHLSVLLVCAFVAMIAMIWFAAHWMAREHTRVERAAVERMVQGGLAGLRSSAETTVRDYAHWTAAYDAVVADDMTWLTDNIGSGAFDSGTTDMMLIVAPDRVRNFGWVSDGSSVAQDGLLPATVLDAMLALIDQAPPGAQSSASTFARVDDVEWLLTVARITNSEGLPDGVEAKATPVLIAGTRIDGAPLSSISERYLISDLTLTSAPPPGMSALPLLPTTNEKAGFVAWTPPDTGAALLHAVLTPLGIAVAILAGLVGAVAIHVVRSARRLEDAYESVRAAQAADKSKTEFLATVTHELRTPMNGIMGMAQLLMSTELTKRQRHFIDVLYSSAETQLELIESLLNTAQIESGNLTLVTAPFAPGQTLRDIVELLTPKAAEKGVALALGASADTVLKVLGDSLAFRQVFTNLIGNALKFTQEGRIDVAMAVTRDRETATLVVSVEDTGPGIAEADQARIFERFSQVDSSPTRRAGGVGLGLAITRSLVGLMGGSITLKSAPGTGSTFTVTLPLRIAVADAAAIAA